MRTAQWLAAAAAGITATAFGPSVAWATSSQPLYINNVLRANAHWNSSSDVISIDDDSNDGYGGRAQYNRGGNTGMCDNGYGSGTTKTCALGGAHGLNITYSACIKNNNVTIQCSASKQDVT